MHPDLPLDQILIGDCRELLKTLPDGSVHCIVTSPPYWCLRSYGTDPQVWQNGHEPCIEHQWGDETWQGKTGGKKSISAGGILRPNGHSQPESSPVTTNTCSVCGAWRGELGLEPTPELYVEHITQIFREVKRVLRDDGTLWLNLGDSYVGSTFIREESSDGWANKGDGEAYDKYYAKNGGGVSGGKRRSTAGLKVKDLCGIPWMVAFALRADGWYLRSDIIWSKPNPMPESVTDRPTKAHEYIFLFAKGQWKTSVVKFSNLPGERFHFFENFGLSPSEAALAITPPTANYSTVVKLCVRLASAIFDFAQLEQNFSLPPFYSEVWQQSTDGSDSDFVRSLPIVHRSAASAVRFLTAHTTTKQFLSEVNRFSVALSNGDKFLVGGIPTELFNTPTLYSDGKGTVTVHDSGEICKVDFVHDQIIEQKPSECKYYYDADAVREPHTDKNVVGGVYQGKGGINKVEWEPNTQGWAKGEDGGGLKMNNREYNPAGRNRRTVWTVDDERALLEWLTKNYPDTAQAFFSMQHERKDVWQTATHPFKGAHFATFPPKLIEPCILAGTSARGVCPTCGAPWERVTEITKERPKSELRGKYAAENAPIHIGGGTSTIGHSNWHDGRFDKQTETTDWRPTCACDAGEPVPAVVLDPFMGSGTTASVCISLKRNYIGFDLNAVYVEDIAQDRADNTPPPLFVL